MSFRPIRWQASHQKGHRNPKNTSIGVLSRKHLLPEMSLKINSAGEEATGRFWCSPTDRPSKAQPTRARDDPSPISRSGKTSLQKETQIDSKKCGLGQAIILKPPGQPLETEVFMRILLHHSCKHAVTGGLESVNQGARKIQRTVGSLSSMGVLLEK